MPKKPVKTLKGENYSHLWNIILPHALPKKSRGHQEVKYRTTESSLRPRHPESFTPRFPCWVLGRQGRLHILLLTPHDTQAHPTN